MNHRYDKVIMDKKNSVGRVLDNANNPESYNFRIVSHYGNCDWSPYLSLREAKERFDALPDRPDGYFLLVEG